MKGRRRQLLVLAALLLVRSFAWAGNCVEPVDADRLYAAMKCKAPKLAAVDPDSL